MNYLKLDYSDIRAKYPKAVKKLEEVFARDESIIQGLTQMGLDLGVVAKRGEKEDIIERIMAAIIHSDPRKLYDIFDDLNIIIEVSYNSFINMWTYHNSVLQQSGTTDSRIQAEEKGFVQAFETLENQLNGVERNQGELGSEKAED